MKPEAVPDCRSCRLGQWYYRHAGERVRRHPAFARIEDPHMTIHAAARESLERVAQRDFEGARKAYQTLEAASQVALELLDELARSCE